MTNVNIRKNDKTQSLKSRGRRCLELLDSSGSSALGLQSPFVVCHLSFIPTFFLVLASVTAFAATTPDRSGQAKGTVEFSRDILPILSDNCFRCHGPDEKARKAKLRFDTKEGAFRVFDGKSVIVPGKSAESELVKRITTKDE